jgi:hypothetical protein
LKIKEESKTNDKKAELSEIELLRRQLATLQEKFERKEEDEFIASFNDVQNRGKKRASRSNHQAKEKKVTKITNKPSENTVQEGCK